jgi:hypothetical protein
MIGLDKQAYAIWLARQRGCRRVWGGTSSAAPPACYTKQNFGRKWQVR